MSELGGQLVWPTALPRCGSTRVVLAYFAARTSLRSRKWVVVMPQPASVETCSPSAATPARRHSLVCLHPSKLYCSVRVANPVISSCGSDQPSKQKLSVGSSLLGGSKEKGSFGSGALTLLRYSWHGESMAKQQRYRLTQRRGTTMHLCGFWYSSGK